MAEIRKHKPTGSSPIAKALEQALGAAVRPVTPGAPPQPNDPGRSPAAKPPTVTGVAHTLPATGWTTISPKPPEHDADA
ncbi:hypothetical protein [Luteococcus japonicus]|uniref:Uncharacterized protein n=1 Tax=Luteococcus japonicus LSP_Lj1 TaxID=1255658 RepID=A0A1R4K971_9ACTN|nr:hypothetical protein [Luteococcus japonicus]SJN40573.1 hypothetical protein FM114_12165 [Luteococcus japonicus LSP_Lj1]